MISAENFGYLFQSVPEKLFDLKMPKQLANGVIEQEIISTVDSAGNATVFIIILLMILQYLLKSSMDKIKNMFLAI